MNRSIYICTCCTYQTARGESKYCMLGKAKSKRRRRWWYFLGSCILFTLLSLWLVNMSATQTLSACSAAGWHYSMKDVLDRGDSTFFIAEIISPTRHASELISELACESLVLAGSAWEFSLFGQWICSRHSALKYIDQHTWPTCSKVIKATLTFYL